MAVVKWLPFTALQLNKSIGKSPLLNLVDVRFKFFIMSVLTVFILQLKAV